MRGRRTGAGRGIAEGPRVRVRTVAARARGIEGERRARCREIVVHGCRYRGIRTDHDTLFFFNNTATPEIYRLRLRVAPADLVRVARRGTAAGVAVAQGPCVQV